MDVSLHSKTHPLLLKYSNGTLTQCYALYITIRACFLCFFYNPYMSLFKNFSFTCPHSFFTCLKQIGNACLLLLLCQPRSEFPNVRGKIQSVGLCTQYTNEMCAPFCTSPNCSTDSSRLLTCNLALGQETVATRFDLHVGLAELRNVRDRVEATTRGFSDSRAWLRKARSYIGYRKNACDICSLQPVSVLGHVDFQIDPSSLDPAWPGRSRSATERRAFERTPRAGAMP